MVMGVANVDPTDLQSILARLKEVEAQLSTTEAQLQLEFDEGLLGLLCRNGI